MRALIASLVFISVSTATAACPTLNATYACEYDSRTEKVMYQTSVKDGVTYLSVNGSEPFRVDGVMRDMPVDVKGLSLKVGLRCRGNDRLQLKSDMIAENNELSNVFCGGERLTVKIDSMMTIAGDTIQENNKGTFMCGDGRGEGDKIAGKFEATCTKITEAEAASLRTRQFPFFNLIQ